MSDKKQQMEAKKMQFPSYIQENAGTYYYSTSGQRIYSLVELSPDFIIKMRFYYGGEMYSSEYEFKSRNTAAMAFAAKGCVGLIGD